MRKVVFIITLLTLFVLGTLWYYNPFELNNKILGNCAGLGERASITIGSPEKEFPKVCCAALKEISAGSEEDYGIHKGLVPGEGYGTICTNCGNGICEDKEHKYNCPSDCK